MRHHPGHLIAVGLIGLTLALTGCTDDAGTDEAGRTVSAEHPVDAEFASQMIPHHAQALVMVDLTQGRRLSAEFRALTEQIRSAQGPEIETMRGWLTEWGEEVPETMRDHVHGDMDPEDLAHMDMDEKSGGMPGMVSATDLAALATAPDARFERLWLTMMIEHHAGAITMAEQELASGTYPPARELAEAIIEGQTAELATMRAMLGD